MKITYLTRDVDCQTFRQSIVYEVSIPLETLQDQLSEHEDQSELFRKIGEDFVGQLKLVRNEPKDLIPRL